MEVQLHSFLTSVLDGDDIHCTGDSVDANAGVTFGKKLSILCRQWNLSLATVFSELSDRLQFVFFLTF